MFEYISRLTSLNGHCPKKILDNWLRVYSLEIVLSHQHKFSNYYGLMH